MTKKKVAVKKVAVKRTKGAEQEYFIDNAKVSHEVYKSVQSIVANVIEKSEEEKKESFVAGLMCGVFLMAAITAIFVVCVR